MIKNTYKDYLTLCKPKVVLLMLTTAWVGMLVASYNPLSKKIFFISSLGIGLAACSAAVINHLIDREIDAKMSRTAYRPIASGKITPQQAIIFACLLAALAFILLYYFINPITTYLTFITLIGYAFMYTVFLKRATPQNIVIGGISGAMPPLLGWCAVENAINPCSLILVLMLGISL